MRTTLITCLLLVSHGRHMQSVNGNFEKKHPSAKSHSGHRSHGMKNAAHLLLALNSPLKSSHLTAPREVVGAKPGHLSSHFSDASTRFGARRSIATASADESLATVDGNPTSSVLDTKYVGKVAKVAKNGIGDASLLVENLQEELMECSRSSWQSGRFGTGNRYANGQQACMNLVERLESGFQDTHLNKTSLHGRWQLIFTNDSVTRSSPFFWVLKEIFGPLSDAYFATLDTVLYAPMSIGEAYQTITDSELISEVDLKNFAGTYVMTTTSHLKSSYGRFLELTMETTQAKGSEWDDVLPSFAKMGDIKFPSGRMFTGFNTVRAEVTFLSDDLRVTRHRNNAYVYRKIA